MKPISLLCKGIDEFDIEIVFDEQNEILAEQTASELRKCIGFAFFGNDELYNGFVKFEFGGANDNYKIERNFEKNTVSLVENGLEVPQADIEKKIKDILRFSKGQWEDFAISSKHSVYEYIKKNVSDFANRIFADTNISMSKVEETVEEYQTEIKKIESKNELLQKFLEEEVPTQKSLDNLENEILEMQKQIAALDRQLGIEGLEQNTKARIEEVKTLLSEETKKNGKTKEFKEKIAKSKAIKEHFSIIKTVLESEKEKERLQQEIENNEAKLLELDSAVETGTKVFAIKQEEYLEANKRLRALNEVFDGVIAKGRENPEIDTTVKNTIEKHCGDNLAHIKAAEDKRDVAKVELADVEEKIAVAEQENGEIRLRADFRQAVREGAALELILEKQNNNFQETEKAIKNEENKLNEFKAQFAQNEQTIKECEEEEKHSFAWLEGDKRTFGNLIKYFNQLETLKQKLYRDQILGATLLQEIRAIDSKIDENTKMKKECIESRTALEGARKTLIVYMTKCDDAIKERTKILSEICAEKKIYEKADKLQFGDACPLCLAPISEKGDFEQKIKEFSQKEKEIREDIIRLSDLEKDYETKLGKINTKLGGYESNENAGATYIESLNQTKLGKLSILQGIYQSNDVQNLEELTNKLESIIEEYSKYNTAICDIKAVKTREELARSINEKLNTEIIKIEKEILPAKKEKLQETIKEISKFAEEYDKIKKPLRKESAFDKLEVTAQTEKREDELFDELCSLYTKRNKLNMVITQANEEIARWEGQHYEVEWNGQKTEYTALCVKVAEERYNEIIDEIRKNEKNAEKCQDEMIALNRIVRSKTAEATKLHSELEENQKKYEILVAYIDTMKKSESDDAKLWEESEFDKVKAEILDDETEKKFSIEIKRHEEALIKYNYELQALAKIIDEANEKNAQVDETKQKATDMTAQMNEKIAEYKDKSFRIGFAEKMSKIASGLGEKKQNARKGMEASKEILEGRAGDLVITQINSSLKEIAPEYKIKLKGEGIAVVQMDIGGIEKELAYEDNKAYIALTVCAVNALRKLVANALNSDLMLKIIKVQPNAVDEDFRKILIKYAKENNLILVANK